jgi:tetratricopeptide (TPR) repeat protein
VNRARLRWHEHDDDGAASDFDKAINLDPTYVPPIEDRSSLRVNRGDIEGARQDANKALELDPQSAAAYGTLGFIAEKEGKLEEAMKNYEKAIEVAKPVASNPFLNRGLVYAYRRRGEFRFGKKDYTGAFADLDKAIEIDPTDPAPHRIRGEAKRSKKDFSGAIADFTKVLEWEPNDAFAYEHRAEAKSDLGDLEGALSDSNKALQLDPKNSIAYNTIGLIAEKRGQLPEAIANYTKAITANDKLDFVYVNRANAKLKNHDLDGAITDYDRAIELNPQLANAYALRANVKQAKGDLDGAMADRKRAFELQPKSALGTTNDFGPTRMDKTKIEVNPLSIGFKSESGSKLPEVTSTKQSEPAPVQTFAASPSILNAAAGRACKAGDFDQAIELSNQALAKTSGTESACAAFFNRGNAYLSKGDFQNALRDFEEATRFHPDHAHGYIRCAIVYSRMKKYEKAADELDAISKFSSLSTSSITASRSAEALDAVARIRATCPEDGLRDGKKAVESAIKACELELWQRRRYVDTLAAAYAEEGDFDQAMKYAEQVLDMHGPSHGTLEQMQQRLALYKEHKPYREEPRDY